MHAAVPHLGIDPAWEAGDPAGLAPEHAQHLAELESLDHELAALYRRGAEVLAGAANPAALDQRRAALLGRERGVITLALGDLPGLPLDERKRRGRGLNQVKRWLAEIEAARRSQLEREAEARAATGLDLTLPGRRPWVGRRHVLAQIQGELLDLFHGMGYSVYTSPEVELEPYNFTKLNFPTDHPARDAHDTYFVRPEVLLRTHTSPGWVRAMEERKPPLRRVFPGRVYRAEHVDATHMDQFHQIDGLFVDRDVSLADLKGTLAAFAREIYGAKIRTRLVPVYFPFVEPGAQMDVACVLCGGTGIEHTPAGEKRCVVCKGTGWLEVLGAGMVHPNVFSAVGYDPEEVTGFAFGMGLERIAMLRYGVPEIRLFLENDLRFLSQF
ncbi:MAG: phenylalanine--tRNA ligase subunit alpha [Candidatus Eisenbacteria bacterium]|uniref:Phenylalanine--tRNA ligase alpha subunit n=1 Tax=Eiseniibacteriota bacterium TaxID=2212470 RepID=A0A538TXV0_UNCEI|nr:MAG: phenylalanine--tRNA ligase subunit alpha [Candidatus Eisenbacteria bacterium]